MHSISVNWGNRRKCLNIKKKYVDDFKPTPSAPVSVIFVPNLHLCINASLR
jgi:hypothetical protein